LLLFIAFKKGGHFRDCSCCSQWLPDSRRRPLRGPCCFSKFSKKDPLFCLQKGGRFAPVVVVICCLRKGGRFAPVVVVICCLIKGGRFAGVVVVPNYCKIQEGGRFAALVGICEKKDSLFCSKGRPLREKSGRFAALVGICGSRFSKKDSLFCLQKGGRFAKKAAAIVAVPIPIVPNYCKIQEGGRFAALVGICGSRFSKKDSLFCLQKGGRFAKKAAAIVAVPIQKSCRAPNKLPKVGRFAAQKPKKVQNVFIFGPQNQLKREKNPIEGFPYI
jgi:hypothetical protein